MPMYFKVDFYFFWRNSQYKNITSFKQFDKGSRIFRHNLSGRQYTEQNVISYLSYSLSQSRKEKGIYMRKEALGPASFIIGPRILESKNASFCSLKEFCEVPIYKFENRPITQRGFGIILYKVFAFKSWWQSLYKYKSPYKSFYKSSICTCTYTCMQSRPLRESNRRFEICIPLQALTEKRSFKKFTNKASKKTFLSYQLKEGLFEKKNFCVKAIQKERTNTILSGEVFKESFTDILQTSLEQVGYSLELHNQKFDKPCKATLWKKLQMDTNRRVPYFTRFFFSFWFTFDAVPSVSLRSKVVEPFIKSDQHASLSNKYKSSYKCLQKLERKENVFFPLNLKISNMHHQSRKKLRKLVKVTESKQNNTKISHIKSFYTSPGNYLAVGSKQSFKKKQRKRLCPTKLRTYWKYERKKDTKIALTIKIGDYLSSGDKIGEKPFSKKKVLQKNKSLFARRPNVSLAFRNKVSHSEAMPLCTSSRNFGGKIVSQNKRKGQKISTPIILGSSGRIVTISKTQAIVQKTQPVLFYKSANLHVKKGNWIKQGAPILTLTHQTLITGDIVQGIPRIEQLFEAFTSPPPAFKDKGDLIKFKDGYNTLHSQVRDIFRNNWLKNRLPIAVRKSLEEIGYILVEMIQKVYLSQGVLIADKHIEIIVRQIASKGQILDSGTTGLFLEEVLPIRQIENANLTTPGKKCLYVPAVMGLTAAALNSDSFISAASFQETTRVLSRDAVVGKSDFLRGLKEKVVIGDLISAGTGLDLYFIYTTMLTN